MADLKLPRFVLYNSETDNIICAFEEMHGIADYLIIRSKELLKKDTTKQPRATIKPTAPLTVSENHSPRVIKRVGSYGGRNKR